MTRRTTRDRVMLVGVATVSAVLLTASLASAHGGATDTVHACVGTSNGAIRIVNPNEGCRANEQALDWISGSATWAGLTGVPAGFADNDDDDGAALISQLRSNLAADDGIANEGGDLVSFSKVNDLFGTILGSYIADGTIGSDDLADGSITAQDLAGSDTFGSSVIGAVTSEKIMDGTITSRDVSSGAITTFHQTANAQVGTNSTVPLADSVPSPVVTTPITVPSGAASNHLVLLMGQATLDCTGCTPGATITYGLGQAGILISPVMSVTVDSSHGDVVLPVTWMTQASGGSHAYELIVTASGIGSGTADVESATLNVIDLGRAS